MEPFRMEETWFEEKYRQYGAMVYRLAAVYLGRRMDAEDVTQEVFLKLHAHRGNFADGEHEKRWLLRVTANLCKNQLKGFWRKRVGPLEEDLTVEGPEVSALLELVLTLPEQYKGPVHLHYYEGYSVAEIGEILGLSQSAVKMRLKRGRDLLKLEWEGTE